jgi:hypothetical protein
MKTVFAISMVLGLLLTAGHHALAQEVTSPKIIKSTMFFKSMPVREMTIVLPGRHEAQPKKFLNRFARGMDEMMMTPIPGDKAELQNFQGWRQGRGPLLNFEGVDNRNGIYVGDPNGEVGLNHYVQAVNSSFAVWDKNGNLLYGPADNKTIFNGLPGPWENYFWADPMFKYDQLADRWVFASVALNLNFQPPYYTMMSVSATGDPLGEYYCYAFPFNHIDDYPKLAVWPDGYYLTYNMYSAPNGGAYLYSLVAAVDREAMLSGDSTVTMVQFQIADPDTERFFPMAADMRGPYTPEDTACIILTIDDHDPGNPWHLWLDLYKFDPDWQVPGNSQFSLTTQFDLGNFEPMVYYGPGATQKGSEINLMTLPLFLMYPVTYRMFNDHESIVCCHTTWNGEIYYITWYELRKEQTGWYIFQSGNYAPQDAHYFMPSISMNGNGDIALGYNVSNEDLYPSIRLTGRQAEDTTGLMTFQELELYKGLNYANSYAAFYELNQWGDYSAMMVDPSDDTTFWFTHQYTTASNEVGNWATRIFSFDLSEDTVWPYAFAGNDTVAPNVFVFTTQGTAENYSSITWTTSGDGQFITNNSEHVIYLRGPGDLDSGQVTLSMHLTGYYPGTEAEDSMVLYLEDTLTHVAEITSSNLDLEIYPNPTRDILKVKANVTPYEPMILKIFSVTGKQLFKGLYNPPESHFELQFDLSYLPPGVYLVKVRAGAEFGVSKLVVR